MKSPSAELKAAIDAAGQAATIARALYQQNLDVRIKADKTPVTDADVRCEIAIREVLESRFPTYGFMARRRARAMQAPSPCGSSTRSMAPRRFCVNIRCSRRR